MSLEKWRRGLLGDNNGRVTKYSGLCVFENIPIER